MSNNIENDVFNKYLEIKQDLVNNLSTIFNRQHYYTHKYRESTRSANTAGGSSDQGDFTGQG